MELIASDKTQVEQIRHSAILFAISSAQGESSANAELVLERITSTLEDQELKAVAAWLKEDLEKYGYVSLY